MLIGRDSTNSKSRYAVRCLSKSRSHALGNTHTWISKSVVFSFQMSHPTNQSSGIQQPTVQALADVPHTRTSHVVKGFCAAKFPIGLDYPPRPKNRVCDVLSATLDCSCQGTGKANECGNEGGVLVQRLRSDVDARGMVPGFEVRGD